MENEKKLKLAMDAGQTMLSNGAETYRVEDTMNRMLESFGFTGIHAFVTTTGIFCSVTDSGEKVFTMVRRVKKRTINLEKVTMVNDISRSLTAGLLSFDEAAEKLIQAENKPPYRSCYKILASGLCCASFSYIFGGNARDFITAFAAGILLYAFIVLAAGKNISNFIINILGGAIVSLVVLLFVSLGFGTNMDEAIIGSIMPLVPGVGLTNAVRDVMGGDYLSGTSRIMDALLVAVCIATGVGVSLGLWFYTTGM